jgi:hypothetical protein
MIKFGPAIDLFPRLNPTVFVVPDTHGIDAASLIGHTVHVNGAAVVIRSVQTFGGDLSLLVDRVP